MLLRVRHPFRPREYDRSPERSSNDVRYDVATSPTRGRRKHVVEVRRGWQALAKSHSSCCEDNSKRCPLQNAPIVLSLLVFCASRRVPLRNPGDPAERRVEQGRHLLLLPGASGCPDHPSMVSIRLDRPK
jgi:hypothetical protein